MHRLDQRASSGHIDFQFVNVAQLVSLLCGEAIKSPYVIPPKVLDHQRMVSMRFRLCAPCRRSRLRIERTTVARAVLFYLRSPTSRSLRNRCHFLGPSGGPDGADASILGLKR